eukprot:3890278-Prymnesium_polylepis.1
MDKRHAHAISKVHAARARPAAEPTPNEVVSRCLASAAAPIRTARCCRPNAPLPQTRSLTSSPPSPHGA